VVVGEGCHRTRFIGLRRAELENERVELNKERKRNSGSRVCTLSISILWTKAIELRSVSQ